MDRKQTRNLAVLLLLVSVGFAQVPPPKYWQWRAPELISNENFEVTLSANNGARSIVHKNPGHFPYFEEPSSADD